MGYKGEEIAYIKYSYNGTLGSQKHRYKTFYGTVELLVFDRVSQPQYW